MATIDLSEITDKLYDTNSKLDTVITSLDTLIQAVKAIPSSGGGEEPPPDPSPTGDGWTIQDAEFYLDGKHQFFVTGANMREGAYPNFQHLDNTKWGHINDVHNTLDSIRRDLKGKVVRVWIANSRLPVGGMGTDTPFCIAQFKQFLSWAAQRELYVIPCFTDMKGSGLHVHEPDPAMRNGYGYTEAWFKSGYKQHYLPFVRAVVSEVENHPYILAWQLGNELQAAVNPANGQAEQSETDANDMYNFFADVAATIREYSNRFVTSGIIDTWHTYTNFQVQNESRHHDLFDIVSFHSYMHIDKPDQPEMGDRHAWVMAHEIPMAKLKKKPLLWDETGVHRLELQGGAGSRLTRGLRFFFNRGGDMALQWAIMTPVGNYDLGWGDVVGMQTVTNGKGDLPSQDYGQLAQAWTDAAVWTV